MLFFYLFYFNIILFNVLLGVAYFGSEMVMSKAKIHKTPEGS